MTVRAAGVRETRLPNRIRVRVRRIVRSRRAHPSGLGLGRGTEHRGDSRRGVLKGSLTMRHRIASAIGAAGIALLIGMFQRFEHDHLQPGCLSSVSSSAAAAPVTTQASSPAATGQASGAATVLLATISGIPAKALVGSNGAPCTCSRPTCTARRHAGACAAAWPPDIVTGQPQAQRRQPDPAARSPAGRDHAGHLRRHPLYYFTADTAAAATASGQGVRASGRGRRRGSKIDTS